jgi:DNA-binding NtrC family response regulator
VQIKLKTKVNIMSESLSLKILLIEDEPAQRELIRDILMEQGYLVEEAADASSALKLLANQSFHVVFSDWKLASGTGLEVLEWVRVHQPALGFVMATAYGTISHAVEAIQAGADDYLSKPFKTQELLLAIKKAQSAYALKAKNDKLQQALGQQERMVDLVGQAPCMQKVYQRIEKLSVTSATVLITGESGTGKELAARALHQLSPRTAKPFIAVNCGAIPESLAEAELFGAEKGAFTGATQMKIGKLEAANGGTLFLDEIGELALNLQPQMLRFLQEGTITRVGSHQEIKLDVRVIAATHRDLLEQIKQGAFREDLYYRLNVVPLEMPPLRERQQDIPSLIEHFLARFAQRYGGSIQSLTKPTLKALLDYQWPGNVRELSNTIERFALLGDEEELVSSLSNQRTRSHPTSSKGFELPDIGLNWDSFEKDILRQAIDKSGGNRTKAAKLLGLSYKAFLYRLEKHHIG